MMSRAAHVLLHQPHARRGLDVEPAAIEADPLADDRHARVALVAPVELDQPRCPLARRGSADGGDQRIALVERIAGGDRHPSVERLGSEPHLLLELGRAEVGGGGVDQVANEGGRLR